MHNRIVAVLALACVAACSKPATAPQAPSASSNPALLPNKAADDAAIDVVAANASDLGPSFRPDDPNTVKPVFDLIRTLSANSDERIEYCARSVAFLIALDRMGIADRSATASASPKAISYGGPAYALPQPDQMARAHTIWVAAFERGLVLRGHKGDEAYRKSIVDKTTSAFQATAEDGRRMAELQSQPGSPQFVKGDPQCLSSAGVTLTPYG